MSHSTSPADTWAPQYFLASVGAGGIAIAFFIWLYMWVPHPGQTVPVLEDIAAYWAKGGLMAKGMMAFAMAAIAFFSFLNLKLLVWNLPCYAVFKATPHIEKLRAQGYFGRYVTGREASAGSYALVCPGVGFSVMMQFFINKGLVGAGILAKFSAAYWAVSAVPALLLVTVVLVLMLNRKHFSAVKATAVLAQ